MCRILVAVLLALWPALASAQFATIANTPVVSDNGDRIATTAWVNNFFATGLPLANGKIIIGSAGGIGTPQTMSGDCTLVASGVITCTQAAGNFNVIGNLTVTGTSGFTGGTTHGSPTGGNKGAGTINIATDYYKNNVIIPETVTAPLTLSAAGLLACPTCVLVSATAHGDSVYAILSTDRYVYTNAAFTAPRVWTLPAANSLAAGTTIWVQDAQNTVTSTNTLTVSRAGADTINIGSTTLLITGAAGGITFTTDGVSNWGVPVQTPSTGGTGRVTLTNHGVLVGAATNPVTQLAVGNNGQLLLGATGADPAFGTMSQDCAITAAGVITCTKTNNVSFATIATSGSASDLGTGTLPVARLSMSPTANSLGADVNLNNTANYFDGPSVAQGTTGTWLASGTVSMVDTGVIATYDCKLWDGTTVIASGRTASPAVGISVTMSLSGFLASPAANIRISCKDLTATTGTIRANLTGNAKDSTVSVIRIN